MLLLVLVAGTGLLGATSGNVIADVAVVVVDVGDVVVVVVVGDVVVAVVAVVVAVVDIQSRHHLVHIFTGRPEKKR